MDNDDGLPSHPATPPPSTSGGTSYPVPSPRVVSYGSSSPSYRPPRTSSDVRRSFPPSYQQGYGGPPSPYPPVPQGPYGPAFVPGAAPYAPYFNPYGHPSPPPWGYGAPTYEPTAPLAARRPKTYAKNIGFNRPDKRFVSSSPSATSVPPFVIPDDVVNMSYAASGVAPPRLPEPDPVSPDMTPVTEVARVRGSTTDPSSSPAETFELLRSLADSVPTSDIPPVLVEESPMPTFPSEMRNAGEGILAMPGMTLASCVRPSMEVESRGDSDRPASLKRVRRRDYCVTYWGDDMRGVVNRMTTQYKHLVAYCVFQREICESSGRPHWQLYIEFFQPQDIGFVKHDLFMDNTTHVEIRLKPRDDARSYCRKERSRMFGPQSEVGPFEYGTWREQGNGQKMHKIREAIADGVHVSDLVAENPDIVLRNRVNFEWYSDQVHSKDAMSANRTVTVRLFVGPTGSGKTHLALQEALYYTKGDQGQIFILDSGGKDNALWFDGYKYGPVLIIDDYDSWIQVAFFLRLMDKYPCRLPVKGTTRWAKYTEVWITSNKPLQQWTDTTGNPIDKRHLEALYRRIDWILWIPERGKYSVMKQPHPPIRTDLPTVEPLPVARPPVPPRDQQPSRESEAPTHVDPSESVAPSDTPPVTESMDLPQSVFDVPPAATTELLP